MSEVLTAFGVDWRLIVIQIFNFALLMGVLWYFLYTPILTIIKERKEHIAKGVQDAEDAAAVKANAEEERAKILTAANAEANVVVEKAKVHAGEKSAEILRAAESKATSVIAEAEEKGEELKRRSQRESEAEIAKTAVLAAEKILHERSS